MRDFDAQMVAVVTVVVESGHGVENGLSSNSVTVPPRKHRLTSARVQCLEQ